MTRLAFLLLGLTALALTGILSWEMQDDAPMAGDIAAPRRPPLPGAAPRRAQEPDHSADWVAHILARPLFSLTRRPPPPATAAQASPAATLPRLTGVLITQAGARAIFAGSDGGKPVVVEEGGNLAGFTLRAILPGAVTVQGPAGETTLHPSFDPTPPPPVTVAGVAPGILPGVSPGAAVPADGGPPAALLAARLQTFRQRQPALLAPPGTAPDQSGTDQPAPPPDQPQAADPNAEPTP